MCVWKLITLQETEASGGRRKEGRGLALVFPDEIALLHF